MDYHTIMERASQERMEMAAIVVELAVLSGLSCAVVEAKLFDTTMNSIWDWRTIARDMKDKLLRGEAI